ncbi:MAG: cell division protein FtsZ [Rhodospirillaceae bacterium]|jgi:cell division protein FtsZ|nr:cell division protein FtsZ [Rhodospirillaceae bacterium]MBT5665631.1 cell division protein FtsZ [Rhodospirillaceae bacterium]MBT5809327.1 cell division protein FtsZ [Rhodospirillaceae bacterium]
MTINLTMPPTEADLRPSILVVGVGGAGGNAVNNMIRSNLEGVEFVVCNTDAQALSQSLSERKLQMGTTITQGLGAGSRPDIGAAAAEESLEEIQHHMNSTHMVFIAAGMGGGTGTGAAPVIARAARDQGILTVGVVTKPFQFEGVHRMRIAEEGIEELQQYVDTLIIIPNQNLFRIANEKTTFADAFNLADDVLHSGVRGVTDLMIMPGLINLDFADIRSVMSEMGKAMMGTGEADGDKRAIEAAERAISNPLLDDVTMKGAKGVLINITGGADMTLFEVDEAANRIREEVDDQANIIFGSTFEESLDGKMRVSVVATGIEANQAIAGRPMPLGLTRSSMTQPVVETAEDPAEEMLEETAVETIGIAAMETNGEPQDQPLPMDVPEAEAETEVEIELAPVAVEADAPIEAPVEEAPKTDNRPAFIPPRPIRPGDVTNSRTTAEPFAAAAMDNAVSEPPAPKRRAPTLFERMTGAGRARPQREEPQPVRAEAKAEAAPAQPSLDGLDPNARVGTTTPEADLLEIPAFLRRQAN